MKKKESSTRKAKMIKSSKGHVIMRGENIFEETAQIMLSLADITGLTVEEIAEKLVKYINVSKMKVESRKEIKK